MCAGAVRALPGTPRELTREIIGAHGRSELTREITHELARELSDLSAELTVLTGAGAVAAVHAAALPPVASFPPAAPPLVSSFPPPPPPYGYSPPTYVHAFEAPPAPVRSRDQLGLG
jgi:hypothetical protein